MADGRIDRARERLRALQRRNDRTEERPVGWEGRWAGPVAPAERGAEPEPVDPPAGRFATADNPPERAAPALAPPERATPAALPAERRAPAARAAESVGPQAPPSGSTEPGVETVGERQEPAAEPAGPPPERVDPGPSPGPGWRSRAAATGVGAAAGPRRLAARASAGAAGAAGRASGAARGLGNSWLELSLIARQRIAAAAIVACVAALVWFVVIPIAPCGAPGGDVCPARDRAIRLVPADALAYAHVDIDPSSDQYAAAASISGRLPLLTQLLIGGIVDVGGRPVDFGSQIRPWAGGEAALAILPAVGGNERATMIEAADPDGARAFAANVLGPGATTEEIGGIDVSVGARKQAAAQLDGFLVLGSLDALVRIIDPAGNGGELETTAGAARLDDLPSARVADAYLSAEGAKALLSDPALAPLDTFVDPAASDGITAALSAEGDVAKLTIRSSLDPELAGASPGFFAALPPFEPSLTANVGADALAYLGLGDPAASVQSLLAQAATSAPGLLAAFNRASESLRRRGGIDVAADLLPLLGTEAALSVEPVAGAQAPQTPGVLTPTGVPYVSLLADGVDSQAAAAALADLQGSLVDALVPKRGGRARGVGAFEPIQIAGIEAESLVVSSNVELTYATYEDRLAIATNRIGIAQARAGGDGLAGSEGFGLLTSGLPAEVSLLSYVNLKGLIALGEQAGLAADPGYATLAPDLRALEAAALSVEDSGSGIRTDLQVSVGQAEPPQVQESAPAPSG